MEYNKGDELSITYCVGQDANGQPILETLDNAIVESYKDGLLEVTYKVPTEDGSIGLTRRVFNAKEKDFSSVKC